MPFADALRHWAMVAQRRHRWAGLLVHLIAG
jgi:hypothetical protein